ncbi:MAG: hypothetical protein ACLFP2_06010 [Candidatus Woesearchaeota archaeon]
MKILKPILYLTLPLVIGTGCATSNQPVRTISGIEELSTDFMELQTTNHYKQRPDQEGYEDLRDKLTAYKVLHPSPVVERMIATCLAQSYSFDGPRNEYFNEAIKTLEKIEPSDPLEAERIKGDIETYRAAKDMMESPRIGDRSYHQRMSEEEERWDGSPMGFQDEMKAIEYQSLLNAVERNFYLKDKCLEGIVASDYVARSCEDSFIAPQALALHAIAWERLGDKLAYIQDTGFMENFSINERTMGVITDIEKEANFKQYLIHSIEDTPDLLEKEMPIRTEREAAYTMARRTYQEIIAIYGASRYEDYAQSRLKSLQEKGGKWNFEKLSSQD